MGSQTTATISTTINNSTVLGKRAHETAIELGAAENGQATVDQSAANTSGVAPDLSGYQR